MHIRDMNSSGCFVASTEQRFASSLFIQDSFVFASPLAHKKKNKKTTCPSKTFFIFSPHSEDQGCTTTPPLSVDSADHHIDDCQPSFFSFVWSVYESRVLDGIIYHAVWSSYVTLSRLDKSWEEERAVWFGGGLWPLGNSRMALAKVAPAIKRRVCEEKWERGRKEDKTWPHHLMHL